MRIEDRTKLEEHLRAMSKRGEAVEHDATTAYTLDLVHVEDDYASARIQELSGDAGVYHIDIFLPARSALRVVELLRSLPAEPKYGELELVISRKKDGET